MADLSEKPKKKFKKKKGTTNAGIEYEDSLIALLAVKLSEDDQIKNFYLSSNDENFGKLDDVIFEYDCNNQKHKYVVQVKHRENKTVTTEMLGNKQGDFSIQQYFSSYRNIEKSSRNNINCVLYTNAPSGIKENEEFELEGVNLKVRACKCSPPEPFLSTDNNFLYKFELTGDNKEYEEFLKHFYLYLEQNNVKTLEASLSCLFTKTFIADVNAFMEFMKYISDWSKQQGNKFCLDKNMVTKKLGEILLRPHMSIKPTAPNIDLEQLLQYCMTADVVTISSNLHFSSFNDLVNKQSKVPLSKEVSSISDEDKKKAAVIAWLTRKAPLVLQVDKSNINSIYKAIKLFEHDKSKRKFLFVTDGVDRNQFKNFCLLQNLNDLFLNSEKLYDEVVGQKLISIQGRQVILKNVINEELKTTIMVDELVKTGILQIGEEKEVLPCPYIEQIVSKVFVRLECINDFNIQSLIVISCNNKLEEMQKYVQNASVKTTEEFLQKNSSLINFFYAKTIVVAAEFCTRQEFQKICQKSQRNSHHFLFTGTALEWLESNRTISDLQGYFIRNDVEETDIFNNKKNINIISAKPGAGKSTMLKFLKNQMPHDFWTVNINFRDHIPFFQKPHDEESILNYFLDHQTKSSEYDSLTLKIRQTYVTKKKIVFLWDGLDELPNRWLPQAIRTVQVLRENGFINWVTTRDFLQGFVENSFRTFALNIKEMDNKHQENYIKKQLKLAENSEELKSVMKKITDIIAMTRDTVFLGIPLRLYILTDLFLKDPNNLKNMVDNNVTLADIIKLFIEEKFKFCYKDKGGYGFENSFTDRVLYGNTKYRLLQYEILALKTFLPVEIFNDLNINTDDLLNDIEQVKNDFGLITKIDEVSKSATFVHDVYGEFLVATWMVKNLKRVSTFGDFIYEPKFRNIRILFDLMLAHGFPAHIAVLHKDFAGLFRHQNHINSTDKGGRSPLHLACSWGEPHPLLEPEEIDGIYVLKKAEKANSVREDDSSKKFLEFLIRKNCDPLQKDELFKWNCIEYADKSLSLYIINFLLTQTQFSLKELSNCKDVMSVSYYCIKFDYQKIFDTVEKIDYVITKQNGNNLIHLAVLHKRNDLLKKLLTNSDFVKHVNDTNHERHVLQNPFFGAGVLLESKQNPLHIAAVMGNVEALDILITHGAKVNGRNLNGETPLHVAIKNKQIHSTGYLLEKVSNLNVADNMKNTILHDLVVFGEVELIKKALLKGAVLNQNFQKETPLEIARRTNRLDILRLLIQEKKALNDSTLDYVQMTLFNAVLNGQQEIINYLLSLNLDLNRIVENMTLLILSVRLRRTEFVHRLLSNGANPNISPRPGFNALSQAIKLQFPEILKLLIQYNANINECNMKNGFNHLIQAVFTRNYEIIEILLKNNINVNHRTTDHCVALHFAAHIGDVKIVELLLKHGAEVNVKNKKGGTPLHVATFYRRENIVELLIKSHADENAKAGGITPEHLKESPELTYPNNPYHVPILRFGYNINPVLSNVEIRMRRQVSVSGSSFVQ